MRAYLVIPFMPNYTTISTNQPIGREHYLDRPLPSIVQMSTSVPSFTTWYAS